tara:strand:+ start:2175 stop:2822 length:648 start_codon:yes stop_codon:yes gene_type:complete
MKFFLLIVSVIISLSVFAQGSYQLAVLKYSGGGDYYANPTAVPNLIQFCNNNLAMNIATDVPYVEVGSPDLFLFPFIHMTGHGNVVFSSSEAENLRTYLRGGGFLHIDDNYGMDEFIRVELKKVFPNSELVELPFDHDVFHQKYDFNGLPKIHEHDGKRSQAFGIIEDGRLLCLYTYETDLSDGWENTEVHNDSKNKRELALKMGANILMFAFMQ